MIRPVFGWKRMRASLLKYLRSPIALSEEITKTTSDVKSILLDLNHSIDSVRPRNETNIGSFLYIFSIWLEHISSTSKITTIEPPTIFLNIYDHTQLSDRFVGEVYEIIDKEISLYLLIRRYNLMNWSLEEDISNNPTDINIYKMIGSMLYSDIRFSNIYPNISYPFIDDKNRIINKLRCNRENFRRSLTDLANNETDVYFDIDFFHSSLSSISLILIFYITIAILDYGISKTPNRDLMFIRSQLHSSLNQLRGALFHEKD